MRIAVVDKEKCQPKKCSKECINFCPRVRAGDDTIVMGEDNKPIISEELCIGCNICVRKCPFNAIKIINLPEELDEEEVHRYGENGFTLYRLPHPHKDYVTGLLGPNGIGKTTAVNILSGEFKPNLGKKNASWEDIFDFFAGSILQSHFKLLKDEEIDVSYKPQYIKSIPKVQNGVIEDLLEKTDERGNINQIMSDLDLLDIKDRDLSVLSGGELQRVAIAACLSRDADIYFLDEITPFLDIYQRKNVSKLIRNVSENNKVIIVEHDLAILDMLADKVHLAYGEPGGYGVVTQPKGVRRGINQYLDGYLPDENVRIREQKIEFEDATAISSVEGKTLISYPSFAKTYQDFSLSVNEGELYESEIVGVVGANAIGKSTMIKAFAGEVEPDNSEINYDISVSYKPQYVEGDFEGSVEAFLSRITSDYGTSYYKTNILKPLSLEDLLESKVNDLSGGELQRLAIAACLSREADVYLLDEPSAHLDVEQRTMAIKTIQDVVSDEESTALVVDHDIYMIDLLSDRLMVFEGEPGVKGVARGPFNMEEGMNNFLDTLGITFRRDEDTGRPRINKFGSHLDRKQKNNNNYYYL
ncbi:ribosome biogenesis/translation initiation ATPase RLI [archaeon SCG-AAA382B04]|nr:ribosome biogenesis/translation initiation ATPase RLI [archaeon SCG-AAA382B04]